MYISLERIVEQSKKTYYESLNKSSQKWHNAKHDILPWFNYFSGTIFHAYKEFEDRAGNIKPVSGAKTEIVVAAIEIRKRAHTPVLLEVEKLQVPFNIPWLNGKSVEIVWTS